MHGLLCSMNSMVSREEYARLVQQYAPQVIDFATRLTGNPEDGKEAAQEAFVKAFRSLASYRGESPFHSWLMRIAYHEAVNLIKRRRPCWTDIGNATPIADEDLSTGSEARIQLMEEAVGELPSEEQTLLHLYYYEDRPLRDIAYMMDAEPNVLATRLHRIRKKLLRMIKQREDEQAER